MDSQTAAILVFADATLGILRAQNGTKWCRDKVMGPLRARLDAAAPFIAPELKTAGNCSRGIQEAADIAARACHACGKCPLGRQ